MANASVMVVNGCTTDIRKIVDMVIHVFPQIDTEFQNVTYDPRARLISISFSYHGEDRTLKVFPETPDDEYSGDNIPVAQKVVFSLNVWGKSFEAIQELAMLFGSVYHDVYLTADDGTDFHKWVNPRPLLALPGENPKHNKQKQQQKKKDKA
jgi:hypothetical protein